MLVSINEDGEKIYAHEALKTDEKGQKINYYCPECGCELILKQGTKNAWHFAHKDDNGICVFRKYDNESPQHVAMKYAVKEIIEEYNDCIASELEYRIGSKIADYYFEVKSRFGGIKKVAVECVQSHTDIDVFRAKNEYYVKQGVFVIWVFNLARFTNKDNSFKETIRTKEIHKECHTMYYGKVYAIDIHNKAMYGIHLDKIYKDIEVNEYYDEFGDYQERVNGGYFLKSERILNPILIKEFVVSSFKKAWDTTSLKFLPYRRNVANVYLSKWW